MLYIVPFLLPHWPVSALEEYSKCCAVCWKWHCRWNSVCNCECSARVCVCWRFLKILQVIVLEPNASFKAFLPTVLNICLCHVYPVLTQVLFVISHLPEWPVFKSDIKVPTYFCFYATVFFKFLSCTALHATQCRQHGKPCYNNCCTVTTHVHSFIQHCLKSGLALPGHLADK